MSNTARDLLELWPDPKFETIAADVGSTEWAVRKWYWRKRIPSDLWAPLVSAAAERGISGVTLEKLASLHARRPEEARA